MSLGDIQKEQGRLDEAAENYAAGLTYGAHDGMKRAVAQLNLGDLALLRGQYAAARRYLTESLAGLEIVRVRWALGAFITDLQTRHPLACHALGADVAEVVVGWAVAIGVPPFVSTYVRAEQRLYPPMTLVNAGIAWYDQNRRNAKDTRLRAAVDPRSLLDQSVICLTLICLP